MRRGWGSEQGKDLGQVGPLTAGPHQALLDGVREPTPERLRSLHAEIMGLGKLVDDLHELSIHDLGALNYRMAPLDLAALIQEVAA